ncbi:MAG: glycosyltransferase family 39 protein [Acidobacteriota bacterium]
MKRGILFAFLALIVSKSWIATTLGPFGDEAFYWQCSQRLALAYTDHPPMTALLVRLGSEVLGDTALGIRLLFLLCGVAFPVAVFWLAQPLVGQRDAWLAAGTTLILPAVAHLGLLAIPDVPMLLLTALFLGAFERATSTSRLRWWMASGLFGGLGLVTHYRFVLAPLAALVYLVVTRRGRSHFRGPNVCWMLAGWAFGTIPAILYNVRNAFTPLRYYLTDRHGAQVDVNAPLEHLAGQALLVTPLLYVALLATLASLVRRWRAGEDRAALLSLFAVVPLTVFLIASPFERSGVATVHWPVPGYLALLPMLPGVLREFASGGAAWRRWVACAAPALAAALMTLVLVELGTGWLRLPGVREPFLGFEEVVEQTQQTLDELSPDHDGRWLVVADNYKLGGLLELALHRSAEVFVLDHRKNRQHGRAPQLAIWGVDETGLRRRNEQEAVVVIEVSQIRSNQHDAWVAHAGSFFSSFERIGELRVRSSGKRKPEKVYWFYRGTATAAQR